MSSQRPKRPVVIAILLACIPLGLYAISAVNYISKCSIPRKSCLEHRQMGCNINGDYSIQLGTSVSEVTCDMQTENGGWTLIANYMHRKSLPGGPTLLATGRFPIQNSTSLGDNEVGTSAWGHVSLATQGYLSYQELRFRCETTSHQRRVDFVISGERCLTYLKTGRGSCIDSAADRSSLMAGSRGLAGNNSQLPGVALKGWKDQADNSLTNYPFYVDYKNHWSIGSLPGRFECDDYDSGGKASTFHQVWAR